MKHARTLGVLALAGALLAGCGTAAHIEKDPAANLDSYRSFTWVDTRESQGDSAKAPVSDLTERNIISAVNSELQKAGWKESKQRPDVLLTYDVVVEKGLQSSNTPVYSNPGTRWYFNPYTRRYVPVYLPSQLLGYDQTPREIREGTVTIRMIDAKTDKTIWQGWTTDQVNSRNLTSREIQSAVRNIFRKFDVASR
ncbi:DUF4136 domain-containing protein [Flaviaesturariibacter amylovorans]|uniref:DUF4136 domain-containing protein n=1 Tax=Flaviaesturariibacter amylovorans TaxID=1084520 RepID=A0ABP8HTH2_9BACT